LRKRFSCFKNDGLVELCPAPANIDTPCLNGTNGGLSDLWADAVTGNERAAVWHTSILVGAIQEVI
jgi:hypothetical protein